MPSCSVSRRDQPGRLTRAHQLFPLGPEQQQPHPVTPRLGAVPMQVLMPVESPPACRRPACPISSSQPHLLSPDEGKGFTPRYCSFATVGIRAQARGCVHMPSHNRQQINASSAKMMLPLYQALTVPPEKSESGLLLLPRCSQLPQAAEMPSMKHTEQL